MMKTHSLILSDIDMDRLNRLIQNPGPGLFRDQRQLDLLDQRLQGADVRSPRRTPRNIVRMNSSFRVCDLETRKRERYTLAFPEQADISRGFLSILAPMGVAFLGHRKGDMIKVIVPGGIRKLRIEQVEQSDDNKESTPPGPSEQACPGLAA